MKTENAVVEKSFAFAVRIVKLYQFLCSEKREFILSKQILRAGTSIGANINEAVYGSSKKDFLNKLHIALKETNETVYWLNLLTATDFLTLEEKESLMKDCIELRKILTQIIKTIKSNNEGSILNS